jgi:D-glycerate 3-kinase
MVGISAPQGCGKTTTVTLLRDLFESDNYRCIVMSLDDFYLTFDEQQELANKFNNNPLLKYRGNAGSHDINLTLKKLNEFNNTSCEEIMIPSYNKMLNNGRGDRNPVEKWEKVLNPNNVDVVLFEGWMLGFQSINPDILSSMKTDIKPPLFPKAIDMNGITQVNDILKDYKALHEIFDQWLVLALDDVNHVYRWRLEQEQASADDNSGLSSDGVKDFVNRFMPAYRAYLENLYDDKIGPERKNGVDVMKIIVGGDRLPSHKIE